jgi:hypothetical protein
MIASWDIGAAFSKEAWRETKESFGWTKKTAAVAHLRLGTAAKTETAAGYFWMGFGPIFAGMVLFAWNLAMISDTCHDRAFLPSQCTQGI